MIERFDEEVDITSVLGKTALLGGIGYSSLKTYKEINDLIPRKYFRNKIISRKGNSVQAKNIRKHIIEKSNNYIKDITNSHIFNRLSHTDYDSSWTFNRFATKDALLKGIDTSGYKGRSKGFKAELQKFLNNFDEVGGLKAFSFDGDLASINFIGDGTQYKIPVLNESSELMLGNNRYVTRAVFTKNEKGIYTGEVEGIDVAYLKKLNESVDDIKAGKINSKDLFEKIVGKSIWEDGSGISHMAETTTRGNIRREQGIVDPFEDMKAWKRREIVKNLSTTKGFTGGSASMQAKGVLSLQNSLLHNEVPGAETSGSIYQLFRDNEFLNQPKPSVNWGKIGGDRGLAKYKTYVLSDYTYVNTSGETVTVTAQESLKQALSKIGIPAHELADEELLVKDFIKKAKISNNIYSYHVNLEEGGSVFTERLLRDITKDSSNIQSLLSTQGLKNPGIILNEKLNKIVQREAAFDAQLAKLNAEKTDIRTAIKRLSERLKGGYDPVLREQLNELIARRREVSKKIDYIIRSKGHMKKAIKNYGILGLKDGRVEQLKIRSNGPTESIRTIRYNPKTKMLDISTTSTKELGEGGKLFGGLKATIDARNVDPAEVAKVIEEERAKLTGRNPINVGDIDILAMESRVKLKKGALTANEAPIAIMQYAENVIDSNDQNRIKQLEEIGIRKNGTRYEYTPTGKSAKEIIETIKKHNEGKNIEDIFLGKSGLGSRITSSVVAPDVHRTQAGIGKKATISERALMNLQVLGLDKTTEDIISRRGTSYDPFEQLKIMEELKNLTKDKTKMAIHHKSIIEDLNAIFEPDLEKRANIFNRQKWGKNILIDLGEEIGGTRYIPLTSNKNMADMAGGYNDVELAAKKLIEGVSKKYPKEKLLELSKAYSESLVQQEKTMTKRMYKIKNVSNSMYGQAASSLDGMDKYAKELAEKMGMKNGQIATVTAMTEADIGKYYNKYDDSGKLIFNAVEEARNNNLWGVLTREPVEGIGSVQFSNIRIAEDFGMHTNESGTIWLSGEDQTKSLARKSLMIDFDKDTISQVALTNKESINELKNFLGLKGGGTIMGKEYLASLDRMSAFDLKGKPPMDILSMKEEELARALFTEKELSKAEIGRFSNTFKNIHIGGRERLRSNINQSEARKFFLSENFSHLFMENVIKSKHQSKESLIKGQGAKIVDLLNKEHGTEYNRMLDSQRAEEMRRLFDEMTFDSTDVAEKVRQAGRNSSMTEELAKMMGIDDVGLAKRRAQVYSEITDIENMNNILLAHKEGSALNELNDYSLRIAKEAIKERSALKEGTIEAINISKKIAGKFLNHTGKYAILPAMAIGIAGTLMSKPKKLTPAVDTGILHENDIKYNNESLPKHKKTLFDIPEGNNLAYKVNGVVDRNTNIRQLANQNNNFSDASIRVQDHREYMNKYTIEEMIEKGY